MQTVHFLAVVLAVAQASATIQARDAAEVRGKRSDDGGPLEAVVQQLTQQVNSMSAQLTQQAAEIVNLKTRAATHEKSVAFYAGSSNYQLETVSQATLILNQVTTNVGNAYDPLTGVFTVPVAGLYDIQFTYMANVPTGAYYYGSIFVDGHGTINLISDSRHGYWDQVTSRVVLHLTAGQKVYAVNTAIGNVQYDGPYTSFSGFLIKAD